MYVRCMKKIVNAILNLVTNKSKVEKQGGQKINENRLEHRLDFIQKHSPINEFLDFFKRDLFFTDPSKIKHFFLLNRPSVTLQ